MGSIDVDWVLDAEKLSQGRYAELLKQLLDTRRYRPGEKPFQLIAVVDLGDGGPPVQVQVEFLAPKEVRLKKNKPKLLQGFRVLQADACGTAFHAPVAIEVEGRTLLGARNKVRVRVASVVDFLIMKAHAVAGRDKPKDAYDLCYCLDHFPGGRAQLAAAWRQRADEPDVKRAIDILREKFGSPEDFRSDAGCRILRFAGTRSPRDGGTSRIRTGASLSERAAGSALTFKAEKNTTYFARWYPDYGPFSDRSTLRLVRSAQAAKETRGLRAISTQPRGSEIETASGLDVAHKP